MIRSFRTVTALTVIIMLVLARFDMPIGYYTLLRLVVSASAVYMAWSFRTSGGPQIVVALFVLLALLYNPIIPIYLGSKAAWAPVNIGTVVLYLVFGVKWRQE